MENEFQYRLLKAISDKGITASELSRLSGVGKADISNYINGKYMAKADKVLLLANALGVDPGWLMTGEEPTGRSDGRRVPVIVPDTHLFMKITNYMTREDYDTVMDIFERTVAIMKEKGLID